MKASRLAACRQPSKVGLSKAAVDAIKAKPPAERVKALMTREEPRVLCVSYFDNGPVHMMSTIHTSAEFVTVKKKVYDTAVNAHKEIDVERLSLIHDYNQHMNNVDRFDQLSHYYNLDGMGWRDRKWWHPVFKGLFKACCDNAYALYKKQFELEKMEELEVYRALAGLSASTTDSPASNTRRCAS